MAIYNVYKLYVGKKDNAEFEFFQKEIQLDKGFAKLVKKNNRGIKEVPTSGALMRFVKSYNRMRRALRAKEIKEKEITE